MPRDEFTPDPRDRDTRVGKVRRMRKTARHARRVAEFFEAVAEISARPLEVLDATEKAARWRACEQECAEAAARIESEATDES